MAALPARILLLEDDPATRTAMTLLLQTRGYEVRGSGTCRDAIACAWEEPIDLLIADYLLPDGDSLTVLHEVKKLYPVEGILITGMTCDDDDLISAAAAEHFARRLIKPIDFSQLAEAIEELLDPQRRAALGNASVGAARAAARCRTLRGRVNRMSVEELSGLVRAMRRQGNELNDELLVLGDLIEQREREQQRAQAGFGDQCR